MSLPNLKVKMACHVVMRRYRHVVRSAATTGFLPFGPTTVRQGSKDDITKIMLGIFGIKDLSHHRALRILESALRDGFVEGLTMTFAECLTGSAIAAACFGIPLLPVTGVINGVIMTPMVSQYYLCNACDLIIILADSFRMASQRAVAQPCAKDVQASAQAFRGVSAQIHENIKKLVPKYNPVKSFFATDIEASFVMLVEENRKKVAEDKTVALSPSPGAIDERTSSDSSRSGLSFYKQKRYDM